MTHRSALRAALIVAVVVGFAAIAPTLLAKGRGGIVAAPVDFAAFYCGGKTLGAGHDPYRAEPLRSCEHAAYAESALGMPPNVVTPAPLPPYALAAFAVLAPLPFRTASFVWALSIVGWAAVVARVTGLLSGASPIWVALGAFGAVVVPSLGIGQLAPLSVGALCLAALAIERERFVSAAAALALAALEPHVALFAFLAVAVWCARARLPIVIAATVLVALDATVGGFGLTREYFVDVLPLHAREAQHLSSQYGLTAPLVAFGMPWTAALAAGMSSFLILGLSAVAIAGPIAKRFERPALLVLVPAAFSVVAGTFVHAQQIALAFPLAVVFAMRARGSLRAILVGACVLLALPWEYASQIAFGAANASTAALADAARRVAASGDGQLFAQIPWQLWTAPRDGRTTAEQLLTKAPTWLALCAVAATAFSFSAPGRIGSVARAVGDSR